MSKHVLELYEVFIVKETPGANKLQERRSVYVVATSGKHALEQLEAVRNDSVRFELDKHESTLVGFGKLRDPKKSRIFH